MFAWILGIKSKQKNQDQEKLAQEVLETIDLGNKWIFHVASRGDIDPETTKAALHQNLEVKRFWKGRH